MRYERYCALPTVRAACALVGLLPALADAAPVYRCSKDGLTVFSDKPCGPDSTPIDIKVQAAASARSETTGLRQTEFDVLARFAELDARRKAEQGKRARLEAIVQEKQNRQAELDAIHARLDDLADIRERARRFRVENNELRQKQWDYERQSSPRFPWQE